MKVERTLENVQNCLCLNCPTYTKKCKKKNANNIDENVLKNSKHFEVLFCAFDKSNCIKENDGCVCMKCVVHKKYKLNNEDYCLSSGGIF